MARWNTCNVLHAGPANRQLWQFGTGEKFPLQREETKLPGEPLSPKIIAKDWQTLVQPKLNVAWLPAGKVFLRVIQIPKAEAAEVFSMLELQLEKLSPAPVAQICWTYELLPQPFGDMYTAIVVIVSRPYVEEFLGQLEGQGYMADRLELPLIDQLRATKVEGNGAWIYPGGADENSCLVAWWYGGVLWNLSLVHLPMNDKRAALLREQLTQATWAGEMEGWMTSPPRYHLVVDPAAAETWRALLPADAAVNVEPPLAPKDLAARTARRAIAHNGHAAALLPADYAARYKSQFVDRLWMRLLGAVIMLYLLGIGVYFGLVCIASARLDGMDFGVYEVKGVQQQRLAITNTYRETIKLGEQVKVLRDQLELQYAALDSWLAIAENMPDELTLDAIIFGPGRKATIRGT